MSETHEIALFDKKPSDKEILEMIAVFFDAQAKDYDHFSEQTQKRKFYLETIDKMIIDRLIQNKQKNLKILSIACGTGKREIEIRAKTNFNVDYTGVDISVEMCRLATNRGIKTINSGWSQACVENAHFDAVFYLHSFGLCPSKKGRIQEIKKIHSALKPNGLFFLDVLNLQDKNEWGPEVEKHFYQNHLEQKGFEHGDLMYRLIGKERASFFHYFTKDELLSLLQEAGFQKNNIEIVYVGYGKHYGQIVGHEEGAMMAICRK